MTGWGSAVYAAEVAPGDDVAVVGIGGIGINAVQGARLAGAHRIFAIDPVAVQAGAGARVRSHPHRRVARGGLRVDRATPPRAAWPTR